MAADRDPCTAAGGDVRHTVLRDRNIAYVFRTPPLALPNGSRAIAESYSDLRLGDQQHPSSKRQNCPNYAWMEMQIAINGAA